MRRVIVASLVAGAALAGLPGSRAPVPNIADETLAAARRRAFAYRRTWQRAAGGDLRALRDLLEFSADAAGGLGHGVSLTELADRIGDSRMAEAIRDLEPERRRRAGRFLEAGVAYRVEWQDPSLTPRLFPLSWAASTSPP
jgi:hypothetical protein